MSNHAECQRWLSLPVPLPVFSGLLVQAFFVQRKAAPGAAVMVQREALQEASAQSDPAAVAGCFVLPAVREALQAERALQAAPMHQKRTAR